jgi:hypothetical protein
MRRSILTCLAALALLPAVAPSAALAQGGEEGKQAKLPDTGVVARLKRARAENRRVEVKFKNTVALTGRVGEVRERGFTFEPDNREDADALKGMGMVAAVLYEDVASVRYPSKLRKFFQGVRTGLVGTGAFFVVMPLYGVKALLGDLPSC